MGGPSVSFGLVAGRYRLREPVGSGGMGRVWLARDEMLQRDVAVKEVIPPEWMTAEERDELRLRTLREAQTAARLSHPHVVQTYDVVPGERPWIVMEYVPSRSLHQVIVEDGPLPPRPVAHIGLCLLAGLTAAHHAGVLHRDVKPHNVLIGHDSRVMLSDFGLATFDSGDGAVTRAGLIMGSPQYVSPERARYGTSTVESDLWSLGATLYAAVEGRSPYARSSAMATLAALATEPPNPTRNAGPLRPVLAGLLRRDPRARLHPDEVHTLLLRVVTGEAKSRPRLLARLGPAARSATADRSAAGASVSVPVSFGPGGFEPLAPALAASAAASSGPRGAAPAPPEADAPPPEPRNAAPAPAKAGDAALPGPRNAAPAPAEADDGALPPEAGDGVPAPLVRARWPRRTGRARWPRRTGLARWPYRKRRWAAAAVAAFALLVATLLVVAPGRDRPTGAPAGPTGTPTGAGGAPTASGTPATVPGAGAGAVAGLACVPPTTGTQRLTPLGTPVSVAPNGYQLFDGWSFHRDPAGFGIAVPDGWRYFRSGATACFRDPDGVRILSVDPSRRPTTDPLTGCQREERRLTANGALPGYRRLRMQEVPQFDKGAEWEYAYDAGASPIRMRARTVWFVASTRHAYAVGWATREFDWRANQNNLSMILASFVPASAD
ncbi:MAG TPA: serine/threonine-protein kinase [Pilimelia sp.]|nr:serine/threonine-protein kinase [Pilimelia sp.]